MLQHCPFITRNPSAPTGREGAVGISEAVSGVAAVEASDPKPKRPRWVGVKASDPEAKQPRRAGAQARRSGRRREIFPGAVIDGLVVLELIGPDDGRRPTAQAWRYRCRCGRETQAKGSTLRRPICGGCDRCRGHDLTDQTFGQLTVTGLWGSRSRHHYWSTVYRCPLPAPAST